MNLKELYQEIILDHGKNPHNLKKIENFNKEAKGHNPLCGDEIIIQLNISEVGLITDVSFQGTGCSISQASASILTEIVNNTRDNNYGWYFYRQNSRLSR